MEIPRWIAIEWSRRASRRVTISRAHTYSRGLSGVSRTLSMVPESETKETSTEILECVAKTTRANRYRRQTPPGRVGGDFCAGAKAGLTVFSPLFHLRFRRPGAARAAGVARGGDTRRVEARPVRIPLRIPLRTPFWILIYRVVKTRVSRLWTIESFHVRARSQWLSSGTFSIVTKSERERERASKI